MPGNPPGAPPAPVVEHPAKKHLPAMVELAAANRGRGVELRALGSVMMVACGRGCPAEVGPEIKRASDRMLEASLLCGKDAETPRLRATTGC
jgi:hypothetical protein